MKSELGSNSVDVGRRRFLRFALGAAPVGVVAGGLVVHLLRVREEPVLVAWEGWPGGRVELTLPSSWKQGAATLRVRRVKDDLEAIVDEVRWTDSKNGLSLILDLPEERWVPGQYELAVSLHPDGEEGQPWSSSWMKAFHLRALPCFG